MRQVSFYFRKNIAATLTHPACILSLVALLLSPCSSATAQSWGQGDFYTLETDANGRSIVNPGATHRKIYVSATGQSGNTGLSENSAVDLATGLQMVRAGSSDWLLLKRGDHFGTSNISAPNRFQGESALNPIVLGAYGSGDRPTLGGSIRLYNTAQNLVVRDIAFVRDGNSSSPAIDVLGNVSNLIIENVKTQNRESRIHTTNGSSIHHVTLRRNVIIDAHRDQLVGDPHTDRTQGLYIDSSHNVLLEENIFDHNAWEDGYQNDATHTQTQEPSAFSHNLYLGPDMRDTTLRENITTRAASMGFKLVSPGVVENNVFVGNNLAASINDGDQGSVDNGGGDFLVLRDNVSLHGEDKNGTLIGARGWGFHISEDDTAANGVIERNVEAHTDAVGGNNTLSDQAPNLGNTLSFEDNVVHNWRNEPNLDPNPAAPFTDPDRTIQTFLNSLGQGTTLQDFYDAIRAQSQENWNSDLDAAAIVRYFQEGFDIAPTLRSTNTTVTFNDAGTDGVRWDNQDNWSTQDKPLDGDNVNLNGHTVNFGGMVTLNNLNLDSGTLNIAQGLLQATGLQAINGGGTLNLSRSGQLRINGHTANERLTINLNGGAFQNEGQFGGRFTLNLAQGFANLIGGTTNADSADVDVANGSSIRILGSGAYVGGYGNGSGDLRLSSGGEFHFVFDQDGVSSFGQIFNADTTRLGFHADADGQQNAILSIDLTLLDLDAGVHRFVLINVDELLGEFGNFQITGLGNNGLNGARLTWDQETDQAFLDVAVNNTSLDGFSYNAILIPEPTTLGLLALGASLLIARRR